MDESQLQATGNILVALLMLAIVVEITLAPIFNWRVFLGRFDGTSYLHPLTLIVTLALLWGYGINPVQTLLDVFFDSVDIGIGGTAASGALIMFGSQGVFRLFDWLRVQNRDRRHARQFEARHPESTQR